MTDRVKGLYVSLDADIRDDDVEYIVNAIRMVKHVQDVTTSIVDTDDWMNRSRIKHEFKKKIYESISNL